MGKHCTDRCYEEFPILNVARRCGLVLNDRTLEREEVEASCPFCGDNGPGKHHLFLNTTRNIFRCVLCGEKGNSVSLYAKLEGVSNRQAFQALSEDARIFRFPKQPLSKKPAEREPSSLAVMARSIGCVVPASAAAPSGETFMRSAASRIREMSRASIMP